MKAVYSLIPTFSSDEFGICSALNELGGMVVMHDASGCNSTYTTHDEPRWYRTESLIFISAISEMEAIMGDDEKLMKDIKDAVLEYHPAFVAIVGAPIPYMIGTDLEAIASVLEEELEIPVFGFSANGMNDYTKGVSMAMEQLVERFCVNGKRKSEGSEEAGNSAIKVNLLGATPLDFSLNGSVASLKQWLLENGMECNACFCMESTLEEIKKGGEADVSLVLSTGGLSAAKCLEERFSIPYVVGVPYGRAFADKVAKALRNTVLTKENCFVCQESDRSVEKNAPVIVGEAVTAASLAAALEAEEGIAYRVLTPVWTPFCLLSDRIEAVSEEEELQKEIWKASKVIADPFYKVLLKEEQTFLPWPCEALSGRIYDRVNPNLIGKEISGKGIKLC